MPMPKALFFDVFGTCVDWRTTVAREGFGERFADDWRARYQPQLIPISPDGPGLGRTTKGKLCGVPTVQEAVP